jgi:hypothetical protein
MAITLTSTAKAKAKTPLGTEPLMILKIEWSSGVKYYSPKPYTFNGETCEDTIIETGSLQSQGKEGSVGEISSLDVLLDDTSGDLKTRVNTVVIEGTVATVYHHYNDLTVTDAIIVLTGKITGPIDWSEGQRTLAFSIESFSGTGAGEVGFAPVEDSIENLLDSAAGVPWPICFGSPRLIPGKLVQQIEPTEYELDNNPEMLAHDLIYIVNLVSSSGTPKVYAKRNCYGSGGYFQVPSNYYTVNLSYSYGGHTVTAILMNQPISTIDDSGWDDEILVSLTSSLSENTATQIKWILDTYSSLSTDAASFSSVASKISNLPSHWALFDQPDSLNLAEEMAWQARCALYVKNNTVYIIYLAEYLGTSAEITRSDAQLKSMELSFTKTEDIVTKFKAEYVSDYSGDPASDKEYIYTRNTDQFGVSEESYTFDIYTNPECVRASATFWGYKYSISWRRMKITTFLPTIGSEAYDWINVSLPIFSTYTLPARILIADRDVKNHEIEFELEFASSAGTHIGGQPSLDTGYYNSTPLISGVGIPDSSILLLTICDPVIDGDTINNIKNELGAACVNIYGINGNHYEYDVVEIVGYNKEGLTIVDRPSADNIEPENLLFIQEPTINRFGCAYSAASQPQWANPNYSFSSSPNWGSQNIEVGDTVGTVKNHNSLAKSRNGFRVVGLDGGEIAVVNDKIDQTRIKIKSTDYIPAFSIAELKAVTEGSVAFIVGIPSANNLAPGRLVIPDTDLSPGEFGYGYNAFDISPFVDGVADPENPNCEMGTKAGTTELHYKDDEGNPLTGFIRLLGEEGKHQVRPF